MIVYLALFGLACMLVSVAARAHEATLPNFETLNMSPSAEANVFELYDVHGAVSAKLTYDGELIINEPMTPEKAAKQYADMPDHHGFCSPGINMNYTIYFAFMDNRKDPHTGWTVGLRPDGSAEYNGLTPDWQTQRFFAELARLEKCAPTTEK